MFQTSSTCNRVGGVVPSEASRCRKPCRYRSISCGVSTRSGWSPSESPATRAFRTGLHVQLDRVAGGRVTYEPVAPGLAEPTCETSACDAWPSTANRGHFCLLECWIEWICDSLYNNHPANCCSRTLRKISPARCSCAADRNSASVITREKISSLPSIRAMNKSSSMRSR